MNPNPFCALNHFTVPVFITCPSGEEVVCRHAKISAGAKGVQHENRSLLNGARKPARQATGQSFLKIENCPDERGPVTVSQCGGRLGAMEPDFRPCGAPFALL